jgi:hypothetical protein
MAQGLAARRSRHYPPRQPQWEANDSGRVSASIPKGKRQRGEDLPGTGTGREGRPGCRQSDQEFPAQQLTIPPKYEGDGCRPYGGHPGGVPLFAGSINAAGCSAA